MILQSHSWAYIQGNHNSKRYLHPSVHCSTIYSSQPECPSTEEWIKKDVIHTIEYYPTLKRMK